MDEKESVPYVVGVDLEGGGVVTEIMLEELSNNKGDDE